MPGLTPYRQIRFPLAGETVDAAAIQNLATDIDTVLTATRTASQYARTRSSASLFNGAVSVAKNTLTTVSWVAANLDWDGGTSGPGAAAYWSAGSPTRLTAPITGLYLVSGYALLNTGGSHSVTNWIRTTVTKNGGADFQRSQRNDRVSTVNGPPNAYTYCWNLAAGDFVTLGVHWNGAPAGPLNVAVRFSIALIALP